MLLVVDPCLLSDVIEERSVGAIYVVVDDLAIPELKDLVGDVDLNDGSLLLWDVWFCLEQHLLHGFALV